jgi:hypothetical protein
MMFSGAENRIPFISSFPFLFVSPLNISFSLAVWLLRSCSALPDGGLVRQIWTILADLKVIWQAKNNRVGSEFLVDFWRI